MLINVRVNDEDQALEFVNDVLNDLGLEETDNIHISLPKLDISPEVRNKHISEGPRDVTIENYLTLNITVDDLDFETQEVIKKHKYLLHRL